MIGSKPSPGPKKISSKWTPRVQLREEPGSILASKIELWPKYVYAPQKFRQHPQLEQLDALTQEALIIEDILYVMMGCEGYYIRYSDAYDPTIEFDRLKGPDFRISKSLDPSLKDLARPIIETAKHYLALKTFIEVQGSAEGGQVNQALCASMRKILNNYLLQVAQLEHQLLNNLSFTLHAMNVQLSSISLVLMHVYHFTQLVLKENEKKREEAANIFNDIDRVMQSIKESDGNLGDLGLTVSSTTSTVCKGGSMLRLIAQTLTTFSGDPTAKQVFGRFLKDASQPYLRMLALWIHCGIIDDPFQEFLVRESKTIRHETLDRDYTDKYWEKRYTIRKDDLPLQFSNSEVYEKILLAGKYLNVVRECGGTDVSKHVEEHFESIEDSRIVISLSSAYSHANQSLLSLLIKTHELPARLRSLKHYFFLDRADFFINFMDIADKELIKSSQKASITKLQYLLDMSLRQPGSISSIDPFKEEVLVTMNHTSVTDYLLRIVNVTGMDPNEALGLSNNTPEILERMVQTSTRADSAASTVEEREKRTKNYTAIMALQLDFKIPFPLSLVLSRKTILRYQLLFRHIVELKNIERKLNNSWVEQMKSTAWRNQSTNRRLNEWKEKTIKLRARMLLFVQQILYYCTMEVIEPNWNRLENNLSNAKTVDLLMEQHVYYLDTCMKEGMLTNQKLLKLQAKLFMACRMFGDFLLTRSKTIAQVDPEILPASERRSVKKAIGKNGEEMTSDDLMKWLESSLGQYESSFDHHVKVLIEALNYFAAIETTALLSLCSRLELCMT